MDINFSYLFQFSGFAIALITAIILYNTIKSDKELNQRILFNEIVKQERELRIKLSEYRENIHKMIKKYKKAEDYTINITLDYDTLLFNYYEYLSICIYKKLINEKEAKLYFKGLLKYVKEMFDHSIMFEEKYASKDQYKALQWLFKRWKIGY